MQDCETEEESQYLLELAIFMLSSTRDVIKFRHYGTNRLLRSLIKVLDLPNHIENIKKDKFLEEIRTELEMNTSLVKNDKAFADFLDGIIVKMLREYKLRLTSERKTEKG